MDSLNVHVKEHLDQSNQIAPRKMSDGFYHCPECGQRTRQSGNMRRHIRQHHTIDMYECSSCNFHTRYNYQLVVHVFKHHKTKFIPKRKKGADGMYHCTQCEYSTPENGNMGRHEQRWHQNNQQPHNKDIRERQGADGNFHCSQCTYRTYYRSNLGRHIQKIHKTNRPAKKIVDGKYKCTICNFQTNIFTNYNRHKNMHEWKVSFDCDYCSYVTHCKTNLKDHTRKNHKEVYLEIYDKKNYPTNIDENIDKQLESVQELNKRPQNQELNKRPQNNVEVNKRLEVIDKNIASLTFSLNDIKTALSGVRGAPGTPLEALPDPAVSGLFPVQTLEDLLELDVKLKEDPAFEASVAKIFHRINEKDLRKTTLALLHHTLGKRLAEVLCWGGSKEKVALTDFQAFTKLLLDTIFLKHNTGEKKDAVIVIQNWLKNAKRRL